MTKSFYLYHHPVFICCFLVLLIGGACVNEAPRRNSSEKHENINKVAQDTITVQKKPEVNVPDTLEQRLIDAGLINISALDNEILIDVKYASEDNFMGFNIYGDLKHIYLQEDVAKRLVKVQKTLKEIDSSLTLLVYDGVRPLWVQQYMWDHLDMPVQEKNKFVSNPKNGSLHNYGCAVDLTIAKNDGTPLDMGAGYDDTRKIAYPSMEEHFLSTGELTQEHVDNRRLLRKVMSSAGFWNIQTEWWHFNAYTRGIAKKKYQPL